MNHWLVSRKRQDGTRQALFCSEKPVDCLVGVEVDPKLPLGSAQEHYFLGDTESEV